MAPKMYETIYTEPFLKDIERLKTRIPRLEEFILGAEELLCRDPNIGKKTKNPYLFALPLRNLPGISRTALYYCFTKSQIIFIMIRTEGDDKTNFVFL